MFFGIAAVILIIWGIYMLIRHRGSGGGAG